MSEVAVLSDESTTEEYRRPDHLERYGLTQHQTTLDGKVSISWTGSTRELIREQALEAFIDADPEGVLLYRFTLHESVIQLRTFTEMKALYQMITDELHRRRIDGRQRNALHRVRDELEDAFEDRRDSIERKAREYWNGHQFRSKGEFPSPTVAVDDVRLDAEIGEDEFLRARVKYHLGSGPGAYSRDHEDEEIEAVIDRIPLMYGYDD